ncbi:gp115 [Sphingomonas phage PAU]|uniref:gp115 n=1 Tax=Sphingomonas phage PAU TaxID=1150991 RepID=UPI0002573266|nr:gp115 [Sphingomonas phage PAU]AFF28113.1 gp115 [Sphingomonas phage PAU]
MSTLKQLSNPLKLKGKSHKAIYDINYQINKGIVTPNNLSDITEDTKEINFRSGADDVRNATVFENDRIVSSCDVGRGLYLTEDGIAYLVSPYWVWDSLLRDSIRNHNLSRTEILEMVEANCSAKGTISGKVITITHINTSN